MARALRRLRLQEVSGKSKLSIVWVDDRTIAKLSAQFCGKRHATDVLTFPSSDKDDDVAGEIVISLDTAAKQAKRAQLPLWKELLLLVIHGILHLQGYNDLTHRDCIEMRTRERDLLMRVLG